MANITISELRPAGADLFSDSEIYLTDLNDEVVWLLGQGWYAGLSYQKYEGGLSILICSWG
ncbi:hypothetical protein PN467_09065 [Microcystis aeruginosa CS-563/04]|uniref:hypothetical protein n=1 Tax=Microcystis aeruginosa TaxID=1126 RepID=UPI00232B8164|nr:hypothetical protein [Microcystis aeruginosa]MDB9420670.1 hypothetical protein [Microcystis aeruginosa CS-563/04]